MRLTEAKTIEFNAETDTPDEMRAAILEWIDEKPSVTGAFLERAFCLPTGAEIKRGIYGLDMPPVGSDAYFERIGEKATERIKAFCDGFGVEMVALPSGDFGFMRAAALAPEVITGERALSPLEKIMRQAAETVGLSLPVEYFDEARRLLADAERFAHAPGDPKTEDKALLENFWSGVEMEVRTQKFAVVKSDLLRGLHFNATGEELLAFSALSEISKKRGFSVVLRRRENKLTFRRFVKLDDSGNVDRASGEARCSACSQILYDHPESEDAASVRIDCDGRGWHI
jgi:hypothetical protein